MFVDVRSLFASDFYEIKIRERGRRDKRSRSVDMRNVQVLVGNCPASPSIMKGPLITKAAETGSLGQHHHLSCLLL